tara:strand:- start:6213 stop:6845 length:633 start_codon:yes stop_codon:yes gene_type:complete
MPDLVLGSTTVISESGGTASINAQITNRDNLPKGTIQGFGFLTCDDTDGGPNGISPGGTGDRSIVFNRSTNGLTDTQWSNPILNLDGSGYFTMSIGYYYYEVCIPSVHQWQHFHLYGVRTYGDSSGSGSTLSNKTADEISLGFTFGYAHSGNGVNDGLMHPGILRVTSTSQKHTVQYHNENNSVHSWSGVTTNATTDRQIRAWASFMKIG